MTIKLCAFLSQEARITKWLTELLPERQRERNHLQNLRVNERIILK
jgi:hypothetical protein